MDNITLISLVAGLVINLSTIFGAYLRIRLKLAELDLRLKNTEQSAKAVDDDLKSIFKALSEIKLMISEKQDRP